MTIRDTIKDAAKQKGWDYKDLAERSGLPRATVHRYLHGKLDLTGGRIELLLQALGLRLGRISKTGLFRRYDLHPPADGLFMEPVKGTHPLFRYPGSKWRLMADAIRLLPPHRSFVSVFGGSATDILRKPRSELETYNDIDGNLHNLFQLLQNGKLDRLVHRLTHTPASSQQAFEEAVGSMKDSDPVQRAWAFLVASYQGVCIRSPSLLKERHWRYATQPHTTAKNWLTLPDRIKATAKRFQDVQLCQWDWKKIIKKADTPDTFFLVDPPFHPDVVQADYYVATIDHEELLMKLNKVRGLVMLLGYSTPLYDAKLSRWRKVRFTKHTSMGINGRRSRRVEIAWMNYDEMGKKIA
jgi:DNA adenine methylase